MDWVIRDSELFRCWLKEHFLAHAVGARQILLILDGHSSHYQRQLTEHAKKFGVIIFCLTLHTTHESQPLDASVFKSLKQNWQQACHQFTQSNPSLAITEYRFSGLLNKAWSKIMNPTMICSGFRKSGIFPFNPDAIDCSVSVDNPEASLQQVNQTTNDNGKSEQIMEALSSIPSEKLLFYQRRLEERYDLPNQDTWNGFQPTTQKRLPINSVVMTKTVLWLFWWCTCSFTSCQTCLWLYRRNISASNARNELFDKMGINLVVRGPTWVVEVLTIVILNSTKITFYCVATHT